MKQIDISIQGGGAWGAAGAGALSRVLQHGGLEVQGCIGTSAGAMNITVMAAGLEVDGRTGADRLLHQFWDAVADANLYTPFQPSWLDWVNSAGLGLDFSPSYQWAQALSGVFTPTQWNPWNVNPLRDILQRLIDFSRLRCCRKTELFVCATDVLSGKPRSFSHRELTVDHVLASATLPFLFPTAVLDGHPYWDGGYTTNPSLLRLIRATSTPDLLLITLNPLSINQTPVTALETRDRIQTLSFNAALMQEVRLLALGNQMLAAGGVPTGPFEGLRPVHFHHLDLGQALEGLPISSKYNTSRRAIAQLWELGYVLADKWLQEHEMFLGEASSCDIEQTFF